MIKEADFIIVGAGSSGCVLADKLSENGRYTVLLVESGPTDKTPLIDMPRGIGKLLVPGGRYVWDYKVSKGGNRTREDWLKGRTLGGSSSINGMVYIRGHKRDYDDWEAAGCVGWGWKDMGPCFVAMEDHELGAGEWRGAGGPLRISLHPAGDPLCEAILNAARQKGEAVVDDVNNAWDGGIGYQPRTIWKGKRQSAARAYLDPARGRANLHIAVETHVARVVFAGRRAVGVELRDKAGTRTVKARREVILSAGALHSPKILQLSGIGDGRLLSGMGIGVVADSPGVGMNLCEHRYIPAKFRVTRGSLNREFSGWRLLYGMLRYMAAETGPMTHAAHEISGLVKTRPHLDRPDAQLGIGLYSIDMKGDKVAIESKPGVTFGGYVTRPKSRGSMRIQSAEADAPPFVDANYLAEPEDRDASVALLRYIRALAAQPALKDYIVGEVLPGPGCVTDDDIVAAFIDHGNTAFHVAGTCRMGADPAAVVDCRLRVNGVDGLRVVDTSVMPSLPSGNTNGPAMAFGLRAAALIQADHAQT